MIFIFLVCFSLMVIYLWRIGGRGLSFLGLLSYMSLVLGLSSALYIYGDSYGGGVAADVMGVRLVDLRERVMVRPGDLSGWLGLLEFYFAVGDFRGGGLVLEEALIYHGGNEDLLVLRDYLRARN